MILVKDYLNTDRYFEKHVKFKKIQNMGHFLYISTVLHFHMYVCYMLINESVSQSVMVYCPCVYLDPQLAQSLVT